MFSYGAIGTISYGAIFGIILTLLVTLILPLIIYVIYGLTNRGKGVWTAWLLGAAGFFVFQVILRMPILSSVQAIPGFVNVIMDYYVLYCLVLALTAALFEVAARVLVAKILQKKLNYQRGVAAGLGHGGIEAMIIVGMTYVNNLIYAIMIKTGALRELMGSVAAQEGFSDTFGMLGEIEQTMVSTPAYAFYLAGYERILTMIFHVAMSLIVCWFVYKKKAFVGVLIAFVSHFLVDFIVPLLNGLATPFMGNILTQEAAYGIVYGVLTVVAIVCIVVIVAICKKWKKEALQASAEA